jgi:hypothetical protein
VGRSGPYHPHRLCRTVRRAARFCVGAATCCAVITRRELGPDDENKPNSKYEAVAQKSDAENLVDRHRNLPTCTLDAVGQASYDEFGESAY